jgi:alpha-tubulin suppressor-like RCC1 family protein
VFLISIDIVYFFFFFPKDQKTYPIQMNSADDLYRYLKDKSLYTSLLPKDVLNLVYNYIIGHGYLFGRNMNGKLGTVNDNNQLVPLESSLNVKDITFGYFFVAILTQEGECWINGVVLGTKFGISYQEELGLKVCYPQLFVCQANANKSLYHSTFINLSELKSTILDGQKITKIVSGVEHVLVLTDKYNCYSFGDSNGYQLGNRGATVLSSDWNLIFENALDIACGNNHSIILSNDHRVYVFGIDTYGQLGHIGYKNVPTSFRPLPVADKIFANGNTTGFVFNNLLYVCGSNESFKLGFTSELLSELTIVLDEFDSPILNVQKVCIGINHSLILANDLLYVCGANDKGQLGLQDIDKITKPQIHDKFIGMQITDITVNYSSSYVVTADKICYVTGDNTFGQLGLGHIQNVTEFTPMPLFTSSFINSITSTYVRAGYASTGLIII